MAIKRYRKKPLEVSAIQFTGDNWAECQDFMGTDYNYIETYDYIDIETLEGTMRCNKGDYIIQGVSGEFYPCKPDIFEKTYEECL